MIILKLITLAGLGFALQRPSPCITQKKFWRVYAGELSDAVILQKDRDGSLSSASSALVTYNYKKIPVIAKYYDKSKDCDMEDAKREAFVLGELREQKNIARMEFCVADVNQVVIFVQKHLGSLNRHMDLFYSQTWTQRYTMIYELNQALIEIHRIKRVQGDIKLDNIVITEDGKKLLFIDFGYSMMFGALHYGYTLLYASPERLKKPRNYIANPKKDIWSWLMTLGVMIDPFLIEEIKENFDCTSQDTFIPDHNFVEFFKLRISTNKESGAQHLIRALKMWLRIEPELRPTLENIGYFLENVIAIETNKQKMAANSRTNVSRWPSSHASTLPVNHNSKKVLVVA